MRNYVEVSNEQIDQERIRKENNFIIIDRLQISLEKYYTCPANVLMIFAHDTDFEYEHLFGNDCKESLSIINLFDDCRKIEQV